MARSAPAAPGVRVPQLAAGWNEALTVAFADAGLVALKQFLLDEKAAGYKVLPPASQVFRALQLTPLADVRVVVVGQDPYHGPGQAHGLAFSVPDGVEVPPSLRNIFKEIAADVGPIHHGLPPSGSLEGWARGGVLLLNSTLTVRARQAGSHQGKGWEPFTSRVIDAVSQQERPTVFLLWGRHARSKGASIDRTKHLVLECAHPSPLSAHNGFLGCRHFSTANAFLIKHGREPVDWQHPTGSGAIRDNSTC